jgi:hypothetical protein
MRITFPVHSRKEWQTLCQVSTQTRSYREMFNKALCNKLELQTTQSDIKTSYSISVLICDGTKGCVQWPAPCDKSHYFRGSANLRYNPGHHNLRREAKHSPVCPFSRLRFRPSRRPTTTRWPPPSIIAGHRLADRVRKSRALVQQPLVELVAKDVGREGHYASGGCGHRSRRSKWRWE